MQSMEESEVEAVMFKLKESMIKMYGYTAGTGPILV